MTFTTCLRSKIFADSGNATLMARSFRGLEIWKRTHLLAWVLMPDHLHMLITLGHAESLQSVVQKVKSNTARELKANDVSVDQVWAPAFHDRALRRDEDLRGVARYVVANPVRAGLVARVGEYPYWDAVWL